MSRISLVLIVAVLVSFPAWAQLYADAASVNLFRQMGADGKLTTKAEFTTTAPIYPRVDGGAYCTIDGGNMPFSLVWLNFYDKDRVETVTLLYTLESPQAIASITQENLKGYQAAGTPTSYRIWVGNSLASMNEVTNGAQPISATTITTPISTSLTDTYKYVKIEYTGLPDRGGSPPTQSLLQVSEIIATPLVAPNDQGKYLVDVTGRYNLLLRPGTGQVRANTADAKYYSNFNQTPNILLNGQIGSSWAMPTNNGLESWFLLELDDVYELTGFLLGGYNNQCWTDLTIKYTDGDVTYNAQTGLWEGSWKTAHVQTGDLARSYADAISFNNLAAGANSINARYLLVSTKGTGQAANQFELYGKLYVPVPEPATMTLLALGGLALLRRRR